MKNLTLTFLLLFCASIPSIYAQHSFNDTLIRQLEIIDYNDQEPRIQMEAIESKYKNDTIELNMRLKAIWKKMELSDSLNLIAVTRIIEKYGWLGADVIGDAGNSTLFIVIQHAHLKVQQKFLPLMRQAVKKGNARPRSLALLEDRVALREGRKQFYGSQVYMSPNGVDKYVLPLEDPENVNKRRASIGLPPLEDYLRNFDMTWDLKQYKKDLPLIEQVQRKMPE